jgi:hypothetical protein
MTANSRNLRSYALNSSRERTLVKRVDQIGEIVAGKLASAPPLKLGFEFREFSIQVALICEASELSQSTTLRLGQVGPNHVSAPVRPTYRR